MCLEFNIAPNTQIGRINVWNPVHATLIKNTCRELTPGKDYWLRRDCEDNLFVDVYEDSKYTKYVTRLIIPEYDKKGNLINKLISGYIYTEDDWKILSIDKIFEGENAHNTDHYMRAGEFVENLVSDNIIEFGKRWLHLAGVKELLSDIEEFYNRYYKSYSINEWYGFSHYYPEEDKLVECPVRDMGKKKAIPAIKFDNTPERPFKLYKSMKNSGVSLDGIYKS